VTPSLSIRTTKTGVCFDIHVNPHASRAEIAGIAEGVVKIRVTAPPVDGAANDAVIALLAKKLGLKKSQLALAAGTQGRKKTVLARDIDLTDLEERIQKLAQRAG